MAENNANNGGSGSDPAMPSKRAEKKQDTRPTSERMRQKETGTMEIDSEAAMEIEEPPKLRLTNKESKENKDKESGVIDMTDKSELTPPNTPGRQRNKNRKKEAFKKTGPTSLVKPQSSTMDCAHYECWNMSSEGSTDR